MSVRTSKLFIWVLALGAAAALQSGCGGDNPNAPSPALAPSPAPVAALGLAPAAAPTPAPMVIPDSNWRGSTSQRQAVSFTVEANRISAFSIVVWINGRACHLPVNSRPMAPIDADGTFGFSTGGAVVAEFSGKFSWTKPMTGRFEVSQLSGPCGLDGPISVSGSYSARML